MRFGFIPDNEENPAVVSYMTMRLMVGIFALLLPVAVTLGANLLGPCRGILDTISAYYYTNMRDVFVGCLSAVALFLFAYKGRYTDEFVATKLASIFALSIALNPTAFDSTMPPCAYPPQGTVYGFTGVVHIISAILFFLTLSYISLAVFTRFKANQWRSVPSLRKKIRNGIFIACGVVMLICLAVIGVYAVFFQKDHPVPSLIYWMETGALVSFAVSWLTKGGLILKDKRGKI